ncbi:MAG TPA: HAD family hydrolase [Gaiella sp.]|nr:HAD family hydrolase [Gaiella sp.]
MRAAAFFDLDRTLISRSSSLALAKPFRARGLIRRRDLARAAAAQLVFARFGAGNARVGQTADSAMAILRGLPVTLMREIAAEAWEPVLKPLVYREALERAAEHHERGERVYIASAALQEVVEEISSRLGFEGAIASRAEVLDGAYTGRLERRLYGDAKAVALRELAGDQGIDLARSTAYSDSSSDVPFLDAVGHPVAVNPDRALRRVASERGWPVQRFSHRAFASR